MLKLRRGHVRMMHLGLRQLNKIGTKDKDLARRLAKLMRVVQDEAINIDEALAILANGYADRDADGNVKVNDQQGIVMRNESAFQLAQTQLLSDYVELSDLDPLTVQDLDKFAKYPDAEVMAQCGAALLLE